MNMKIVELGDRLRKPVVAASGFTLSDKESAIYVISSCRWSDSIFLKLSSLYLRTTAEMLKGIWIHLSDGARR